MSFICLPTTVFPFHLFIYFSIHLINFFFVSYAQIYFQCRRITIICSRMLCIYLFIHLVVFVMNAFVCLPFGWFVRLMVWDAFKYKFCQPVFHLPSTIQIIYFSVRFSVLMFDLLACFVFYYDVFLFYLFGCLVFCYDFFFFFLLLYLGSLVSCFIVMGTV